MIRIQNRIRRVLAMKIARTPLAFIIIIVLVLSSYWGCAKMEGDRYDNEPPVVTFVNTPKDGNIDSLDATMVYDMPFTFLRDSLGQYEPITLVSFPSLEVLDTTLDVAMDPSYTVGTVEDIYGNTYFVDTDFSIDYEESALTVLEGSGMKDSTWTETDNPAVADTTVEGIYYTIEIHVYLIDFKLNTPSFYIFSYAPSVHWTGSDADGFVEGYYYADIEVDRTANPNYNPEIEKNNIPDDAWVFTLSTSAVINLLSEEGEITEHVVYVKCVDDKGLESAVVFRTFYRSNQAPNTPLLKWEEQPDTRYAIINAINTAIDTAVIDSSPVWPDSNIYEYSLGDFAYDTLFCMDNVTPNWLGIKLRWKGTDPDDKELIIIPLDFTYTLEKLDSVDVPNFTYYDYSETIFSPDGAWVTEMTDFSTRTETDTVWSEQKSITITHLETADYRFRVWSRDDGLEPSVSPAFLYFFCIKPLHLDIDSAGAIIVYDETAVMPGPLEYMPIAEVDSFYCIMLNNLQDDVNSALAPLGSQYGYDFSWESLYDYTSDVVYWENNVGLPQKTIPYSLIHKYRLVIHYADDHKNFPPGAEYMDKRDKLYSKYLDTGGRIWFNGRCLMFASFGESSGDSAEWSIQNDFLEDYLKLDNRYAPRWPINLPFEFTGANKAVDFLDDLAIDTVKRNVLYPSPFVQTLPDITGGLPEIDWMGRSEDVTTLYYFNSITADTFNVLRENVPAIVKYWDSSPPMPEPTGTNCFITVPTENLTEVITIYNYSKEQYEVNGNIIDGNPDGEVVSFSEDEIYVSYPNVSFTYEDANVAVLDKNDMNVYDQKLFSNPSFNGCWLETERYNPEFLSPADIINVTRQDTATEIIEQRDLFNVRIGYKTDKNVDTSYAEVVNSSSPGWEASNPAYFLPQPDSCILRIKRFLVNYDSMTITNVTKNNASATFARELVRWNSYIHYQDIVIHTNGVEWSVDDELAVDYKYRLYWEKGDELQVTYVSDLYWEYGDDVKVTYNYNPMTNQHLKPVAIRYEDNPFGEYGFPVLYYRTAMFTFPLFFMENPIGADGLGPVDRTFREMLIWFLYPYVHTGEL